jgi:hypothetical protein
MGGTSAIVVHKCVCRSLESSSRVPAPESTPTTAPQPARVPALDLVGATERLQLARADDDAERRQRACENLDHRAAIVDGGAREIENHQIKSRHQLHRLTKYTLSLSNVFRVASLSLPACFA